MTKKRKHSRIRDFWHEASTVRKVSTLIASVGAATVMLYGGLSFVKASAKEKFGEPPYAGRDTEIVVAGWQADRVNSNLRDIKARIDRLETQKKLFREKWSIGDQKELDYWYDQERKEKQTLQDIETNKKPVAGK